MMTVAHSIVLPAITSALVAAAVSGVISSRQMTAPHDRHSLADRGAVASPPAPPLVEGGSMSLTSVPHTAVSGDGSIIMMVQIPRCHADETLLIDLSYQKVCAQHVRPAE
jgi:hypothetical protein